VPAAEDTAVSAAEAEALFGALREFPALILAVSGGPDSTALLLLAARWRKTIKRGPNLVAVTIDHALRPQSKAEAEAVKRLARRLGIAHRTLRWTERKPKTGLQEAARNARYRLLADAAHKAGARHVVTAHTLDDQAETVLIRLACGSGVSGLAGMGLLSGVPVKEGRGLLLVRPLLRVPKSRLIATLKAAKVRYADDPTNFDSRFTRPRVRALMPALVREGLTAQRLARLAQRVERAENALFWALNEVQVRLAPGLADRGPVRIEAAAYLDLPEEIALRLLGRAIDWTGDEGPVELGKLEALNAALSMAAEAAMLQLRGSGRFRRTLAGSVVSLAGDRILIERAPPRRRSAPKRP
jgi:tRNA(Ile)-lysidine synthase